MTMVELSDLEIALMSVLADEWERSGPPGFLETTAIAEALKIKFPDAKSIIH